MSEGARIRDDHRDGCGEAELGTGGPAAVPLLEDLPALLGLLPIVRRPEPDAAPAGEPKAPKPKGRRPLAADLRTRPFSVRLTRDERALLYRAALAQDPGEQVSCWARKVLVAVARALAEAED